MNKASNEAIRVAADRCEEQGETECAAALRALANGNPRALLHLAAQASSSFERPAIECLASGMVTGTSISFRQNPLGLTERVANIEITSPTPTLNPAPAPVAISISKRGKRTLEDLVVELQNDIQNSTRRPR